MYTSSVVVLSIIKAHPTESGHTNTHKEQECNEKQTVYLGFSFALNFAFK